MNPWQHDVEKFHYQVCGPQPSWSKPVGFRRPELRAELIREEAKELRHALRDRDMVKAIDGMVDLVVVTVGTAAEFGIDLDPFWNEVHRSNMAKAGGPVREDGKRLKPEGWTPPELATILEFHDRSKIAA
jgi:predicted HAD superfamily Cof-like phosphohydrolase